MAALTFPSKKSTTVPNPLGLGLMRAYFGLMSRLVPAYIQRQVERIFTTPPRYVGHAAQPVDTRRETVAAGTRSIAVWQAGPAAAPAVLLAHGWGGRGLQLGAFVAPLLEAGYRVVWFDQPGHGESDRGRTGLPDFVRALKALATTHGPFAAAIGHSLGAGALGLALREGLALERVVMIATPSSMTEHTQRFARFLGLAPGFAGRLRAALERHYHVSFAELDRVEALGASVAKILLIHDTQDAHVEFRHASRIQAGMPSARLLPTHDLGHFRIVRDPQVVRAAVDFVRGQDESLPAAIPPLPLPAPLY